MTMTNDVPNNDAAPATAPRRGSRRPKLQEGSRVLTSVLEIEERQCQQALAAPDVKSALHAYEVAHARRDSISRKLCGGSAAVTVADLAHSEESLTKAEQRLAQLARLTPALERHPTFSAVIVHLRAEKG